MTRVLVRVSSLAPGDRFRTALSGVLGVVLSNPEDEHRTAGVAVELGPEATLRTLHPDVLVEKQP